MIGNGLARIDEIRYALMDGKEHGSYSVVLYIALAKLRLKKPLPDHDGSKRNSLLPVRYQILVLLGHRWNRITKFIDKLKKKKKRVSKM